MKNAFPTIAIASVERVLNRNSPPSVSDRFWSYKICNFVNPNTGKFDQIETEKSAAIPIKFIDEDWFSTLVEAITDTANTIHRKNLKRPADFVIFPSTGPLFSYMQKFACGMFKESQEIEEQQKRKKFVDADYKGTLYNKFNVHISNKLSQDKILVGLISIDPFVYNIIPPTSTAHTGPSIPNVNVAISNDPNHFVNEVSYWGYINILDLPTEQDNK